MLCIHFQFVSGFRTPGRSIVHIVRDRSRYCGDRRQRQYRARDLSQHFFGFRFVTSITSLSLYIVTLASNTFLHQGLTLKYPLQSSPLVIGALRITLLWSISSHSPSHSCSTIASETLSSRLTTGKAVLKPYKLPCVLHSSSVPSDCDTISSISLTLDA